MWIEEGFQVPNLVLYMWKSMMKIKHWLIGNLRWEISSSTMVESWLDPIKGFNGDHSMFSPLIKYIHTKGLYYLNQIYVAHDPFLMTHLWIKARELDLIDDLVDVWEMYIHNLNMSSISLLENVDILSCDGKITKGQISVKNVYNYISIFQHALVDQNWFQKIWKWELPLKLKCLSWLV